ncbi:unnamed protein product, partial [Polarella glacialis]
VLLTAPSSAVSSGANGNTTTPLLPELTLSLPSGDVWPLAWHEPPLLLRPTCFGQYRLRLKGPGGQGAEVKFKLTSVVAEYAEALDNFFEALAWSWDGSNWTDELSDATVNLVVGIDEFMDRLDQLMRPLLPMLGGSFKSMLDTPRRQLEHQLARVLDHHDATAIGQTHTALRDLLQQVGALSMMGPMLGCMSGGSGSSTVAFDNFTAAAAAFEAARQAACSTQQRQHIREELRRLLDVAERYMAHVRMKERLGTAVGSSGELACQWDAPGGLRAQLERLADEDCVTDLMPLVALQGGGGGMMSDMFAKMMPQGSASGVSAAPAAVESLPFLDPDLLSIRYDAAELRGLVARWSESLVNGAVMVGSPIRPMRLSCASSPDVEHAIQVLQRLLELGFGYVAQGDAGQDSSQPQSEEAEKEGMLIAVLDRRRATLPLCASATFLESKKRRSRLRDVVRVLRSQAKRGRKFALRINSDLELALKMLREHHEDSWVGDILQGVWRVMFERRQLVVFELWVLEDGVEKMIAADFGHPHSTFGFYVATRFFDRSYKTCMPGFILAFAAAQVLFKHGFGFWDLGGTNASPMMAYKPQVALELLRDEWLDLLSATRQRCSSGAAAPRQVVPGVAIAEIGEDDLWSALACRDDPSSGGTASKAKAKTKAAKPAGAPRPKTATDDQPPSAESQGSSARAKFQVLYAELCSSGMEATAAAAEALRRLSQRSSVAAVI